MSFITVLGRRLEYRRAEAARAGAPTLVFLHEGLGSLSLWRDFPDRVAQATGAALLVWSRHGYGRSDPIDAPRGVRYMHEEALTALPALLDALAIENPVLVGHSDGASIALIHAGAGIRPVRALILEAPHVFVEDLTIASIEQAREAYRMTDLRRRLGRHHADPDNAFRGWNDIWLNPAFRAWNIEEYLPGLRCPTLIIQGADDEYGTAAQAEAIARQAAGPVETLFLPACRHSPHRDQEEPTLDAMTRFIARLEESA